MDNTIEKEATEFASSYKDIEAEVRHAFMCGAKWMQTQCSTLQYSNITEQTTITPEQTTITPEVLTATGWRLFHSNENVSNFEKEIDDVYVTLSCRNRIGKIDVQSDGAIHARIGKVTVSQLNMLFELVGLDKFKINARAAQIT